MEAWRDNMVEDPERMAAILRGARRVAVLGIKTEGQRGQPAYYVPEYLQNAGYDIVPVPVYYPEVTEILGRAVYRTVASIPDGVDLVVVFRLPRDIPAHVPDLIAAGPGAVWFQLGIRNDQAAEELARAGILVVQDRCSMVEHRGLA